MSAFAGGPSFGAGALTAKARTNAGNIDLSFVRKEIFSA
jgi:hypothetical protein